MSRWMVGSAMVRIVASIRSMTKASATTIRAIWRRWPGSVAARAWAGEAVTRAVVVVISVSFGDCSRAGCSALLTQDVDAATRDRTSRGSLVTWPPGGRLPGRRGG
jgi:hypothetical protein